jgi:phosphinothricin acetyltransferase
VHVRDAAAGDAAACAAIYAPFVTDGAVTFEVDPPDAAEFARRIAAAQEAHAWLVLADGVDVLGYAYAGPWKARAAYRWSCEVTIYLRPDARGRGAGRILYDALFDRLAARGYRTLVAGVTLPNDASVGLHRALGFRPVGTFERIGYKSGAWRDVAYFTRHLPGEP